MNFREAAIAAARRNYCRSFDLFSGAGDFINEFSPTLRGVELPAGALPSAVGAAGSFLLSCDPDEGPYPPFPPGSPGFTGGQCNGVEYRVEYTISDTQSYVETHIGPIGAPQLVFDGPNNFTGPCRGEFYGWTFSTGAGTQRLNLLGSTQRDGNSAPECADTLLRPTAFAVFRTDGLPDDCGDAPGSEGPRSQPETLTYTDPNGNEQNDPVTITIGDPYFTSDGGSFVPVTITGPDYEFPVDVPINGDEPTIGDPVTSPDGNRCCPEGTTENDPPATDEEEPEESDRLIVGAFVTTTTISDDATATEFGTDSGPSLYFPRLGSIVFGIAAGGSRAWLNPIDVQTKRSYIPCPYEPGATEVVGKEIAGVQFTITPVFAALPERP